MSIWSHKLIILLTTFFIGVSFVAFWYLNYSNSVVNVEVKTPECFPQYSDNFGVADYKGILTRQVYSIDKNNVKDPVLDQEASAKATADLFSRFREIPFRKLPTCVNESYRLTWIPTFHAPTIIRVWRSDDKYFLTVKRLNGKGGYGLGDLELEQTNSLTFKQWKQIETLIQEASFWENASLIEESIPNDGAAWLFEGFNNCQYHYVYRRTPTEDLSKIFKKLFELSQVNTEYEMYLN